MLPSNDRTLTNNYQSSFLRLNVTYNRLKALFCSEITLIIVLMILLFFNFYEKIIGKSNNLTKNIHICAFLIF